MRRSVGSNALSGLQIKEMLQNEETGCQTNARSAKGSVSMGVVNVLAATGLTFWSKLASEAFALICGVVLVLMALWGCLQGMRVVKHLKIERKGLPR